MVYGNRIAFQICIWTICLCKTALIVRSEATLERKENNAPLHTLVLSGLNLANKFV